jgi:hypothetical protein
LPDDLGFPGGIDAGDASTGQDTRTPPVDSALDAPDGGIDVIAADATTLEACGPCGDGTQCCALGLGCSSLGRGCCVPSNGTCLSGVPCCNLKCLPEGVCL